MARVGRFELVRELGSGGFGTVWEAFDSDSGQRVAVKLLDRMGGSASAVRAQLLAETDALRAVDSPNTLRVVDVVDEGDVLALVTDFMEAAPLRSVLDAHGTLSGRDALTVLYGAGMGLAAVHAAGLVHGDVKPANILIEPSGNSKLIDFGLVSLPGWIGEDSASPWGSPAYAPPEQVAHEYRDHRSDIYSLTVTLYEVLCGQRPFTGDTIEQVRRQHVDEPLPDPRLLVGDLGDKLTQLLMWGLAKDPDERPQDVGAWLEYLAGAAEDKYGPSWFTAASVGSLAGGLLGAGVVASGVAVSGAGASAVSTAAAATAASGASTTATAGTGVLSTVAGKVAVGAAVTALAAGGGIAAKAALDDPAPDGVAIRGVETIAYVDCADECTIYTMLPDGTGKRLIAKGLDPAFSPDGSKIAFTSYEDDAQIHVVPADGSAAPLRVAAGESPAWSPDGKRIAFRNGSDGEIAVADADADGKRRRALSIGFEGGGSPIWSPDGSKLAFMFEDEGQVGIVRVADGPNVDENPGRQAMGRVDGGAWSPGGSRFVIADCEDATDDTSCSHWQVVAFDGEGRTKLWAYDDTGKDSVGPPSWSPDGQRVAFVSGKKGLVVLNGDGEEEAVLAESADVGPVRWSPSGKQILHRKRCGMDACEIWSVNADGSGKTREIANGVGAVWGAVPKASAPVRADGPVDREAPTTQADQPSAEPPTPGLLTFAAGEMDFHTVEDVDAAEQLPNDLREAIKAEVAAENCEIGGPRGGVLRYNTVGLAELWFQRCSGVAAYWQRVNGVWMELYSTQFPNPCVDIDALGGDYFSSREIARYLGINRDVDAEENGEGLCDPDAESYERLTPRIPGERGETE